MAACLLHPKIIRRSENGHIAVDSDLFIPRAFEVGRAGLAQSGGECAATQVDGAPSSRGVSAPALEVGIRKDYGGEHRTVVRSQSVEGVLNSRRCSICIFFDG